MQVVMCMFPRVLGAAAADEKQARHPRLMTEP